MVPFGRPKLAMPGFAGSCGKFVVSSAGEAYDARDRGPNRNSIVTLRPVLFGQEELQSPLGTIAHGPDGAGTRPRL